MPAWQGLPAVSGRGYKPIATVWPRKAPIRRVRHWVRVRSDVLRLQLAMARTSDSHGSLGSASDHSNTTSSGSFKSCSSSAVVKSVDQTEFDLLASETLSLSDEDSASNITPTFSDKSEAPQPAAATAMLGWLTTISNSLSGNYGCIKVAVAQDHRRQARLRML